MGGMVNLAIAGIGSSFGGDLAGDWIFGRLDRSELFDQISGKFSGDW